MVLHGVCTRRRGAGGSNPPLKLRTPLWSDTPQNEDPPQYSPPLRAEDY